MLDLCKFKFRPSKYAMGMRKFMVFCYSVAVALLESGLVVRIS
ncbi:MAG: hypothetical protein AB1546_13535 [bacterium]